MIAEPPEHEPDAFGIAYKENGFAFPIELWHVDGVLTEYDWGHCGPWMEASYPTRADAEHVCNEKNKAIGRHKTSSP